MASGQMLIIWLHPFSTSNVALNTRTCAHGPLMGHPNWIGCDRRWGQEGLTGEPKDRWRRLLKYLQVASSVKVGSSEQPPRFCCKVKMDEP
jgi:hypothetical protein